MIIVDTNVISELMRPMPDRTVRDWALAQSAAEMHTTSISLAEINYGIERLPGGRRRERMRATAADVFTAFRNRVLAFDAAAAQRYATLVPVRDAAGLPIDGFDAQIASICSVHNATLATRNVKDFRGIGIDLQNPWDNAPS